MAKDLLIEIGTEELPPKALKALSFAFSHSIEEQLDKSCVNCGELTSFAAPRRLAVVIKSVDIKQSNTTVERLGPAVKAAFDDEGNPTKAAEGFARSCGIEIGEVDKKEINGVEKLYYSFERIGQPTTELVPSIVEKALADLPIPKRMRWADNDYQFVRPIQWVTLMLGEQVIDAEIMGNQAGNTTRGHRFHAPVELMINEPANYASLLREHGKVEASFERRKETIRKQVLSTAADLGGEAVINDGLLDEVTALVEWPVAIAGNFEERFLDVPKEALITTMEDNQKYFAVLNQDGGLLPHFITISNIESRDPKQVSEGNERVIRPRFADAEFFWNQDRKHKLEDNNEALKNIVFQNKLGSLYEKVQRVSALAGDIADKLGSDIGQAKRAGILCKADLVSEMVYEFSSMQGIAGRYYAEHDGEAGDIPAAMEEQYKPRFSGDSLPQTQTGNALSLADKLDTLVGIWAAGQKPTGAKDPFALRRTALGILRIIIEGNLDLGLLSLIKVAASNYPEAVNATAIVDEVYGFILERQRAYFQEQGYTPQQFEAVASVKPSRPSDFLKRLEAVKAFNDLPQAASLSEANKRIRNILKKSEGELQVEVSIGLMESDEERMLLGAIQTQKMATQSLLEQGEYTKALKHLADIKDTVDAFFDNVMVMAEDDTVKNNRLALLSQLRELFLQVADLSALQG